MTSGDSEATHAGLGSPGGPRPAGGPLAPGSRLGPWVLEAELARGGQGVVYRGRHAQLTTPAAVKVLLADDRRAAPEEAHHTRSTI